jgi:high-affinity iron transporter
VGGLLYLGLLRIPLRWFFSVTAVLVLLLAASMASQVARNLVQADLIPSLGAPVWDSSAWLSQSSPMGTLLHGLVGYDAQPAGAQLLFYLLALLLIGGAMLWVGRRQPATDLLRR